MSQPATRKATVSEDKEKRTDSPAKDLKKKTANVEKDKQTDGPEQNGEKSTEAKEKVETNGEKSVMDDKPEEKTDKPKQNGSDAKVHNGVSDVTLSQNGAKGDEVVNGTVSEGSDGDDEQNLVIDDDELFPELAYDDSSDVECFEPPTPDSAASRSFTRRSQAKAARTPETPRPASDKPAEKDAYTDESKDKLLKMKDNAPSPNRKLRSTDSPKRQEKKEPTKVLETPKKREKSRTPKPQDEEEKAKEQGEEKGTKENGAKENGAKQNGDKTSQPIEVVVQVEGGQEESRKPDTNFSKSRVKVSPYRRSIRLADQTNTSTMANYTGNNTTMEMDLTENSSVVSEEQNLDDSSFLKDIKTIRGRRAFKSVKDLTLKYANKSERANISIPSVSSEHPSRPTGTVVGRKRKPDSGDIELGVQADESIGMKRMRLLDRLPFRWTQTSTPIARRSPEILGVNSDLPLSAPVVVDAESIKSSPIAPDVPPPTRVAERDSKRCVVM